VQFLVQHLAWSNAGLVLAVGLERVGVVNSFLDALDDLAKLSCVVTTFVCLLAVRRCGSREDVAFLDESLRGFSQLLVQLVVLFCTSLELIFVKAVP
jgi:hypothetical protein